MSTSPQKIDDDDPVDERLTQLVSYLDGELNDTQMDDVEQSLINDPDMRSHADILSRTWAMLDTLGEVSASKNFTKATLATISIDAAATQHHTPGSRFNSLLGALARYKVLPCFLLGVLGATAGFFISEQAHARRLQRSEEFAAEFAKDHLVTQHLDMLLKDDLYRIVPDAEALRQLKFQVDPTNDGKENP
jgi:anti-sigma factor RsiW